MRSFRGLVGAVRIRRPILPTILALVFAGAVLAQSPRKTAIKITEKRQLFIDDFLVDSITNLRRVLHRPELHPKNPIMMGTENWENWLIGVNGRAVIYDEETQEFKMWYGAYSHDPSMPYEQGYRVCYAFSTDGVNWIRPNIGQVEWRGSRKNNMISWGENWMRRPNVIKDTREGDLSRRYKMTYVDMIGGKSAIILAHSRDGIEWKSDGKPWFRIQHSSNLLGWDPKVQQYVLYTRADGRPTSIARSTSSDFKSWSEPEKVLGPDPKTEASRGFAGNAAFLYEDVYLGLLWVFDRIGSDNSKFRQVTADTELIFSRDGIKWERPFPGNFFFPRGQTGTWDQEGLTPVAPVVYKDRIWIYYSGWNYPYGGAALKPVQEGWIENGMRMQCAIGLATLRLDGFVSLDAGKESGVLTTKALMLSGPLIVNADVRGELIVEILDGNGRPLRGFSAKDCDPIRSDNIRHVVTWKGKSSLAELRNKSVKLRFTLRDGSLFSVSSKS